MTADRIAPAAPSVRQEAGDVDPFAPHTWTPGWCMARAARCDKLNDPNSANYWRGYAAALENATPPTSPAAPAPSVRRYERTDRTEDWDMRPRTPPASPAAPAPIPGEAPESLDKGWFPSRCVICWKRITQYDTYGVSSPPGRRWHWDCVCAEAAHVGTPAAPAPSGADDEPYEGAITLAQKVLDRVNADPDGDIAILARQFLRCAERSIKLTGELAASREVANELGEEAARAALALADARAECARLREAGFRDGVEAAAKVVHDAQDAFGWHEAENDILAGQIADAIRALLPKVTP